MSYARDDKTADQTTQIPFGYRYRVGEMIITAVTDGFNAMPLKDGFVRNAPLVDVQAALAEACLAQDTLYIPFTPIVVCTGGEEVFPKADIFVPEVEWDFWTNPAHRAQAPDAMKSAFANVDRVFAPIADKITRYRWDSEVAPGIVAIDASGHTPGHTAFILGSGDARLVLISDMANHPALFVRNPGWSPAFDIDPEKAVATRRRIFGMIASEHLLMAGFHVPFPGVGHIVRDGDRFAFVPAQWMQTI